MKEPLSPEALLEFIRHRRSIPLKDLSPDPIDLDLVARMLEAGNWAPSHGKTEPWRFVVFSGEAREVVGDAFGEAYRDGTPKDAFTEAGLAATRDKVWKAPVWIALGVAPDPARPEWEELIAFGCAVMNMQLMACALGLGCKWTSGKSSVHPLVAEAVGFGHETHFKGFLYVGRPAFEWPVGERGPIEHKVRWEGGQGSG
ncbi:MAG: nitroreductase family protein [Gemmatimonadota bacterium]